MGHKTPDLIKKQNKLGCDEIFSRYESRFNVIRVVFLLTERRAAFTEASLHPFCAAASEESRRLAVRKHTSQTFSDNTGEEGRANTTDDAEGPKY